MVMEPRLSKKASVLVMVAVIAALTLTVPWATLLLVLFAYLGSIPLSISAYSRLQRQRPAGNVAGISPKDVDADHI